MNDINYIIKRLKEIFDEIEVRYHVNDFDETELICFYKGKIKKYVMTKFNEVGIMLNYIVKDLTKEGE